jgi:Na+/melibiose symporter-like transporter
MLNEFFVLVISCCLIGFCNENLSNDGEEYMGWFLIAWINIIAGFNMLLALYKTVKETYGLLREKCCP